MFLYAAEDNAASHLSFLLRCKAIFVYQGLFYRPCHFTCSRILLLQCTISNWVSLHSALHCKRPRPKDSQQHRSFEGSLIYLDVLQDPFDSQSSFCDPATRLCLCEVDKSVVTVVLPSDRSVQIHCMLNGCVVEDVRKGTISAFPR